MDKMIIHNAYLRKMEKRIAVHYQVVGDESSRTSSYAPRTASLSIVVDIMKCSLAT